MKPRFQTIDTSKFADGQIVIFDEDAQAFRPLPQPVIANADGTLEDATAKINALLAYIKEHSKA